MAVMDYYAEALAEIIAANLDHHFEDRSDPTYYVSAHRQGNQIVITLDFGGDNDKHFTVTVDEAEFDYGTDEDS